MEKENNSNESDFSENEIPDLNSLKPFKFEPKTNIGYIISSSSDNEDEGAEYKLKRISNNEWCECSAKTVVGRCSSKQVSGLTPILKTYFDARIRHFKTYFDALLVDNNTGKKIFAKYLSADGCFVKTNTINCDDNDNAMFPITRGFAFTRQPMK